MQRIFSDDHWQYPSHSTRARAANHDDRFCRPGRGGLPPLPGNDMSRRSLAGPIRVRASKSDSAMVTRWKNLNRLEVDRSPVTFQVKFTMTRDPAASRLSAAIGPGPPAHGRPPPAKIMLQKTITVGSGNSYSDSAFHDRRAAPPQPARAWSRPNSVEIRNSDVMRRSRLRGQI